MKSTVLILLCLTLLFSLLVKETDCTTSGVFNGKYKREKDTRLNYRRSICAAARELDCACKRELEKDRQQEQ
ncbi:unnamed protein product [Porites lobata]|uniref:Uncharacterized protein n=1 Tax=Porites lobata TaxID=104759 RepID=A0ABN8QL54_9CNID|nr:unnamed protein product [Porites lobata]